MNTELIDTLIDIIEKQEMIINEMEERIISIEESRVYWCELYYELLNELRGV